MNKLSREQINNSLMHPILQHSLDTPTGQFWNSLDSNKVKEAILTNASKTGFVPIQFKRLFPESTQTVLDFGCGIGRNIDALRENFSNTNQYVGYDLPGMLSMMPLETRCKYDRTTSNFNDIKSFRPRIIFASLVFQHIPTKILLDYIYELGQWPCLLYVHSRWYNDQDKDDVFDLIANSDYFVPCWTSEEALMLTHPDKDPELHWSAIFSSYRA